MFNTCELFPFFCLKESESDKYIQCPSICFRFFKKELEKADGLQTLLLLFSTLR